ncbi:MAG: hydroxymethylglutaryl-CoA lyase [Anaerolineae bacterium]
MTTHLASMDDVLKVYEVGPRDGLQNEARPISTADKCLLVGGLVAAGLRHIELTSFVHPQAVPQMADADDLAVWAHREYPNVDFVGLVFNRRGYDRALAAGCKRMSFGVSVSETFSQRNTRMSAQRALDITRELVAEAKRDGVWTRVYVMTAWVCPFEGRTNPLQTIATAEKIWALGVDELAIADTIGHANPLEVGRLMEELGRRLDMRRLAVHLHDTQALGLANATVALQAGVRIIDSSIGGLGGCPFAPGAAGNLATEDLVFAAYKMGLGTGVDFERLWQVVYEVERMVGRPIGGRIRAWWESTCLIEPDLAFK